MTGIRYEMAAAGCVYNDAPAAIDFLERAFGFERGLVVPGEDGTIVHSQLWAGDFCVSVASVRRGDPLRRITPADAGGVTGTFWFVVNDPDAHYERAKAAGAEIVHPPMDQEYGGRDYTCRDPEGNVWSFGTYRPSRNGEQ